MTTKAGVARRAAAIAPFHVMAMARRAAEREAAGHGVVHLEVGQPAATAPPSALAAVIAALGTRQHLGYTNAAGLPTLRSRIVRHYAELYGVDVDVDRVLIVSGASAGFTLAFLACFDSDQRVAVVEPGYPCCRNTLIALGVEPVAIAVDASTRWVVTPAMLDAARPLDGLVLASPSNPTGTMLPPESIAAIAGWADRNGVRLISDEIYHGITYGMHATTALSASRSAVVVNSFSKYFCMTGWRVGWVVVPDDLVDAVERLQQNLFICAPSASQVAALAAFDDTQVLDAEVEHYATNRAALCSGLAAAGIVDAANADGAFYVYADVSHLAKDSAVLCDTWLVEAGVAATPGLDFDLARGHRYVRFSYAGALDTIVEACERLARWQP